MKDTFLRALKVHIQQVDDLQRQHDAEKIAFRAFTLEYCKEKLLPAETSEETAPAEYDETTIIDMVQAGKLVLAIGSSGITINSVSHSGQVRQIFPDIGFE